MSTDILISRREARRRKILDNSEDRLKLITRRADGKEISDNIEFEENGSAIGNILLNGEIKYGRDNCLYSDPNTLTEDILMEETLNFKAFDHVTTDYPDNYHPYSMTTDGPCPPSHLIYIFIAILTRLLIELNSHYIFGKSMLVAFLLTKCGVLGVYGLVIPEGSRLLQNLLFISGITPQKIKLFIGLASTIYSILKEFALYAFVFIFSDVLFTTFKGLT